MRHSTIEIPLYYTDKTYDTGPEYVKYYTLRFTEGSLDKFITNYDRDIFRYEGKTEQGIERFKYTEKYRMSQFVQLDEIMFIPEDHPLFNCYVITNINYVITNIKHAKLFFNIKGTLPRTYSNALLKKIRGCVLASIEEGAD